MLPASPRRATRLALSLPLLVIVLQACSDASSPVEPRPLPTRPQALVGPIVTVTNTDNAGAGSLRQAIIDAPDGATIQFDPAIAGQTIVLSGGELVVGKQLTIEAPMPRGMTISGGHTARVFFIQGAGNVVFRNLSIVDGRDKFAGGLYILGGSVVLDHSLVANNAAAEVSGGGIFMDNGNLAIVNSTISGNTAFKTGGGILAAAGSITIRNSTIAFNTAEDGGGIFLAGDALTIRNSIIANNVAMGASTPGVPNCVIKVDAIFSGRNISNDDSCGPASDAMIVDDPRLKPLGDNGGPTKTHAIDFGAAVDKGLQCSETTDQRYVERNKGFSCDLGAYEFDAFETVTLTFNPNGAVNKAGVATVSGTVKCSRPTSFTVSVIVSQTQKISGRFSTIVKAENLSSPVSCTTTPSSWSAVLTPQSGSFQSGAVDVIGSSGAISTQFILPEVTAQLKLFQVK